MSGHIPADLAVSVTEALQLLGNLSKLDAAKAEPKKPPFVYADALRVAQSKIDGARTIAAAFPAGAAFAQSMDAALRKASTIDGTKHPNTAKKTFDRAIVAADTILPAAKQDYADRKAPIDATLAGLARRIANVAAAPNVTQALQAAQAARTTAIPAADNKPNDWTAAFAALTAFQTAVDAIQPACVSAARAKSGGLNARMRLHVDKDPLGKDFSKRLNEYGVRRKAYSAAIQAGDGLTALEQWPATDAALTAFEQVASPTDQQRQQLAINAKATIDTLTDQQLTAKPLLEKAEIALDLCAAGKPAGEARDALVRLYNKSTPDPQFATKRGGERQQIIDAVLQMPETQALFDATGKVDRKAWNKLAKDTDKMLLFLSNICNTQCDTLGMPRIALYKDPDPPRGRSGIFGSLTFGGYNPGTNDIGINLHKDCLSSLKSGLDTIIHETFHAHQDYTVRRLRAGDIKPTDPEYATAMMWLVNDVGVGYVDDKEVGQKNYEKQPTEYDSFHHAGETINGLLLQAKANAGARPGAGP